MDRPAKGIQDELRAMMHLLEQGPFFSVSGGELEALREKARDLSLKISAIEGDFLTIGLLGGTGVGKSTVMNALAGSEIASTSHRRPHTDQILIYRHAESGPLHGLKLEAFPWKEIYHHTDSMGRVLLCDLPDFDSLKIEHREQVLSFLEHLDILVWVTSPEKYADKRFYEFLRTVPKAKQNFFFLLNKVDLFFEGQEAQKGVEQMTRVARSFQMHIQGSEISEPVLFLVSAKGAMDSGRLEPWNQFQAFRGQIFHQRDLKEVLAIKEANLHVEVKRLASGLQKETLYLKEFQRILAESIEELERLLPEWLKSDRETFDLWVKKEIHTDLFFPGKASSILIGPGRGLALLLEEWQYRFREMKMHPQSHAGEACAEAIAPFFRRRLQWMEDRMNQRLLLRNLPPAFGERIREIVDTRASLEDLKGRLDSFVQLVATEPPLPSFRGFKVLQGTCYLLLLAFFLFAIGDSRLWSLVIAHPQWRTVLGLAVSGIQTLFSPQGVAALGSYALLNLFLAFRFFRRYKRLRNRMARKMGEVIGSEIERVWQEKLDSIRGDLKVFNEAIGTRISTLEGLMGKDRSFTDSG